MTPQLHPLLRSPEDPECVVSAVAPSRWKLGEYTARDRGDTSEWGEVQSQGKMKSYKTLVELYGKKTADNIRIAKKEKEQHRDPAKDPKPYWLPHPDGIEDPEPRTDFVCAAP